MWSNYPWLYEDNPPSYPKIYPPLFHCGKAEFYFYQVQRRRFKPVENFWSLQPRFYNYLD